MAAFAMLIILDGGWRWWAILPELLASACLVNAIRDRGRL
jgi:hypothetical protein